MTDSCRPDNDGRPTVVDVNIFIRSMGPVLEAKSIFTLDIYFRQYWTDSRLVYNSSKVEELGKYNIYQIIIKLTRSVLNKTKIQQSRQ